MTIDLAVLAQDPRFGGGGVAQTDAFCAAARGLGREPVVLSSPHPGLDGALSWRRAEALRQLAAAYELEPAAREARSLWVVSSLAQHGGAATRSGRPYGCWIGTTIAAEWAGRAPGLGSTRRVAASLSVPGLRRLERRVLRGAVSLYATSAASRVEVADAAGCDERAVDVLPIPVDADRFHPATDDEWRGALAAPVLVFVGRANDPRKNIGLLYDVLAQLRKTLPTVRLILVGEPPAGGVPAGIEARGYVPDVAAELRRAGLFVLPARQEGFCIAAAEALACGLPVVSTPCGGPEDLLQSSGGGIVVGALDACELAAAIEALVCDPARAARMRIAGRAYVERVHAPDRFRDLVGAALARIG